MKVKTAWELAPWYRSDFLISGREDGADGADGADGNDGDDDGDADGDDDSDDDDDDDAGSSDSDKAKDNDTTALRKALREERTQRKALEKKDKARERADARKASTDGDKLTETAADLEKSRERESKLAAGYLNIKLNAAIEKAARDAKFKDPDDALAMIKRGDLEFDQDEDDPSQVDIDLDSVKTAVKKLAAAKKHLISSGTDDDDATGSTFGRRNGKKPSDADVLKERYPSLRY